MFPVVRKYCLSCHGDKEKSPLAKADQGGFAEGGKLSGKRLWMGTAEEAYRVLHPYIHRPGPESEETMLPVMDYHASTSPLVQMLRKGHHGVKMAPEDCLKIYEWIDLNCPFHGKWSPPSLAKPDHWVQHPVPDQAKRRKELAIAYANVDDDPEAEHDRYAAVVAKREVKPVAPEPTKPAPSTP